MPQLKSQQYSKEAFKCVNAHVTTKQNDLKKYKTFAKRFPTLIHTCGLAQAISFANSKEEYRPNFKDLQSVLAGNNNNFDLIQQAQSVDVLEYLRLSREAIVVAGWLKKYAEALIEDEK